MLEELTQMLFTCKGVTTASNILTLPTKKYTIYEGLQTGDKPRMVPQEHDKF